MQEIAITFSSQLDLVEVWSICLAIDDASVLDSKARLEIAAHVRSDNPPTIRVAIEKGREHIVDVAFVLTGIDGAASGLDADERITLTSTRTIPADASTLEVFAFENPGVTPVGQRLRIGYAESATEKDGDRGDAALTASVRFRSSNALRIRTLEASIDGTAAFSTTMMPKVIAGLNEG